MSDTHQILKQLLHDFHRCNELDPVARGQTPASSEERMAATKAMERMHATSLDTLTYLAGRFLDDIHAIADYYREHQEDPRHVNGH